MATRSGQRTEEQKAQDRAVRAEFAHKPSWDEIIASGAAEPGSTTLGAYLGLCKAMNVLKREREASGLTLDDVAERSGLDAAAIGALEEGRVADPSVGTLARYAAALGKVPIWNFADI